MKMTLLHAVMNQTNQMNNILCLIFVWWISFPIDTISQLQCDSLLTAFYSFDENANDASGNGHHGIASGNALIMNNLTIPNDNESAVFLPNIVLQGAEDFTFLCRVKFSEFQTVGTDPINVFINGFSVNNAFVIGYRKLQNIVHLTFSGVGLDVPLPFQLEENQWYCFTFTRQGSIGKVFIDGEQVSEVDLNPAPLVINGLVIGQDQDCIAGCFAANQSLAGTMDNIRIYRRALEQLEVASLCHASVVEATICEGFLFENYSETGEYIDFFQNDTSCDSMRVLILSVLPVKDTTIEAVICEGEIFSGYSENGTYTDHLQTWEGCDSSRTIALRVIPGIYTPNSFSPNGDGINDHFTFFGGDAVTLIVKMKIFNRWGGLVFQAENIPLGDLESTWDGNFKDKTCQSGIYTWFATVGLPCGKTVFLEGDVFLIR